jgi:restriction system protein
MTDTSTRRTGEFLRVAFKMMLDSAEAVPSGEVIRRVGETVPLTEYERGFYTNGAVRFDKIIRFGSVDCVKAGWLVKAHGRWSVTDAGREAYQTITNPEAFYRRAKQLYAEWRKQNPKATGSTATLDDSSAPDDPGEKSASITFDAADEQAWSEIERHVTTMDPYDLQDLVAALLRGMGYHIGYVAPKGKDGGVDIIAFNDPLGTSPPRIKVQVKRQDKRIPVDGLRSFMAVLSGDDAGIFVNTGGFTDDAKVEARNQHSRRVTLIDLERLVELWTAHYEKLEESARRRMPLKPIYFLAPEG